MLIRVLCVSLVVVFGNQLAAKQGPSELAERLARFDERTARIEDLTAKFEQQKHSILLRQPLVSRGTVRVKGETIRWDTREPIESVIRIDERDARIYYPDQNLMEIYRLGTDLRFLAGSPVPRLEQLVERFEIRGADLAGLDDALTGKSSMLVVSLTPRDQRMAERIERIRLVLDEGAGVMRLFELVDPQGERSVITFHDIQVNRGLKDRDVELWMPKSVRISRPFGGGRQADESEQDNEH